MFDVIIQIFQVLFILAFAAAVIAQFIIGDKK